MERIRSTQKLPIVFGCAGLKAIGQSASDRQHDADANAGGDESCARRAPPSASDSSWWTRHRRPASSYWS